MQGALDGMLRIARAEVGSMVLSACDELLDDDRRSISPWMNDDTRLLVRGERDDAAAMLGDAFREWQDAGASCKAAITDILGLD